MRYIKNAFLYHWNLLAVATGIALAFLSGRPDVLLPLFSAAEIMYLAILSTRPRFQDAVDAQKHKGSSQHKLPDEKLQHVLSELSEEDLVKYERLKNLCVQLRRIADRMKGNLKQELEVISDVQVSSINRLLWMYLKLLYSKNALESFFKTINVEEIKARIDRTKKRLEALGPESDGDDENIILRRKSLMDTLKTSGRRLANYQLSIKNYEFIGLELERLNSKIASLAEMGINRQDTTLINSEIDSVSSSIEQTERAMDELDFITGLSYQDETPPDLLADKNMKETLH